MTGTIHLIVEDETDIDVVRAICNARNLNVRVRKYVPTGGSKGISRLAKQLDRLIISAQANREEPDCIAVLHDADTMVQQDRILYDQINNICKKYNDVVEIIAKDEIESWLLADGGLCAWLGERPRNCDMETKPSERLNRAVKAKTGKDYSGRTRGQVLEKLKGDGDNHSPSLQAALRHLEDAPCLNG